MYFCCQVRCNSRCLARLEDGVGSDWSDVLDRWDRLRGMTEELMRAKIQIENKLILQGGGSTLWPYDE